MAPGRPRNDAKGWERGVGHYSRDYAKFDHPKDPTAIKKMYGKLDMESRHGYSGPVSKGGPPRHRPKSGPITNGAN